MRFFIQPILLGYALFVSAQGTTTISFSSYTAPVTEKSYFRFGNNVISLVRHGEDNKEPYVLISLHNNETTSISTAINFIARNGGTFYELVNNNQRNIVFELNDKKLCFDPNRIFTIKGRTTNLKLNNSWTRVTNDQVQLFAGFILERLPKDKVIVAVHNNTDEEYKITDYQKGGKLHRDAKWVHQNPALDEDDFFLTTNASLFEKLKAKNYNVILQNNNKAKDDGSLSIYCAKMNIHYINIETQHDHLKEQQQMLDVVKDILYQ